jgi:importin subunit beta-1
LCRYEKQANVTSDLADAFPNGEFQAFYRQEWLSAMIKDTRQNREFSPRTIETARWAREQVKRQIGGSHGNLQT